MKILYGLLIVLVIVLFMTYQYNHEGFEDLPVRTCKTYTTNNSAEIGSRCVAGEYVSKLSYDSQNYTYLCCPVLQGPQGAAGEIGTQGLSGVDGVQGSTGPQGPIGDPGYKGAMGPQGVPGPRGEKGPKGKIGEIGKTGPQGADAVLGDIGKDGTPVNVGPQGPVGDTGPQGPAGDTGPAGMNGIKPDENEWILDDVDYDVNSAYVSDIAERTINLVALQRNARSMLSSLSDPDEYNQVCAASPFLAQGNEFNTHI